MAKQLRYIKTLIGIIFCVVTCISYAAAFTATVTTNKVSLGQSIELQLSLTDANAKSSPNLGNLESEFVIYRQQQYSSFSNVNGNISALTGWDLILMPKHEGDLTIPSITINTNKGNLSTQPIKVVVTKDQAVAANSNENNIGVSLIASLNKVNAYVKEPIQYTLKIVSYRSIANVTLEDIKATDAIIDKIGQPKQYEQIIGGLRASVIEVKYYVTPLVPGNIVIMPAIIRGEVHNIPPAGTSNRFGIMNNFIFDSAHSYKPFSLTGDKVSIKAMAPEVQGKDWLPLQNLVVSEQIELPDHIKAGETITRKIKMVGTGGFANQLPSLKAKVEAIQDVKIYSDKPRLSDTTIGNNDVIVGTKEESFSLVPQQAGKIIIPAIKITWWNTKTKQAEVSSLPGKTIEVLPGSVSTSRDTTIDYSSNNDDEVLVTKSSDNNVTQIVPALKAQKWLWALIAGLVLVIIAMLTVIIYLLKRRKLVSQINEKYTQTEITHAQITSVAELRDHILGYAQKYWHIPKNTTLAKLGVLLSANHYLYDQDLYRELSRQINAGLYASGRVDLVGMIKSWESLRRSVSKNKRRSTQQGSVTKLNPT